MAFKPQCINQPTEFSPHLGTPSLSVDSWIHDPKDGGLSIDQKSLNKIDPFARVPTLSSTMAILSANYQLEWPNSE